MRCNNCKANLEKGVTVCPECGETVQKKKFALPVWAAICISILVVAALVIGVIWAVNALNNKNESPFVSYTGTESNLIEIRDRVVAKIGDRELTNSQLQIYYWIYIYDFLNENSYYLSIIGLDYTKDLATQACYFDTTKSWQEYFLDKALEAWQWYGILNIAAEEAEFTLPETEQTHLDSLKEKLDEQAQKLGFKDGQEWLEKEMGAGATFDAYIAYYKDTFIGNDYCNKLIEEIVVTEEDIAKYYADNLDNYDKNGIAKKDEAYCVSVRHILIAPVTKDADGNTIDTEVAWETCRQEAQKILDGYLAGGKVDEEAFATLAKTHTTDGGSKQNGGLYADFARGEMVEEFEDWSFDATRKYGDTGLVKSQFGYHIMFFVDSSEVYCASVRHILIAPVTKDANGNTIDTEVAWETCRKEAQKLLDSYRKSGKIDEEAFAALAKEHTTDDGSKENGGLYTKFPRGAMTEEFEDWSFDTARKYGDTGLVKTKYGYHIMFFVNHEFQWHYYADNELRMEASGKILDELMAKYPMEADYNKMLLGHVSLGK